jgi:hypothetical protein
MGTTGSLITLLALPIPNTICGKSLVERLRSPDGTIGGAALFADGVTTLGSCVEFSCSTTLTCCVGLFALFNMYDLLGI